MRINKEIYSLEYFKECIYIIQKQRELEREFCNGLNKICDGSSVVLNWCTTAFYQLLDKLYDGYDLIEWWLLESEDKLVEIEGEKFDLSTIEDFHKFLLDKYVNKELEETQESETQESKQRTNSLKEMMDSYYA